MEVEVHGFGIAVQRRVQERESKVLGDDDMTDFRRHQKALVKMLAAAAGKKIKKKKVNYRIDCEGTEQLTKDVALGGAIISTSQKLVSTDKSGPEEEQAFLTAPARL